MALFSKKFIWLWFFLFSAVFIAQVVPRIYQESPTNDEPIELTNGYFYWKGDLLTHDHHPPVSKVLQALPLQFMGLKDNISATYKDAQLQAYVFFFDLNRDKAESMTQAGRWISLIFGLALGGLLLFSVRHKSFQTGFFVLILWAFHPTILAYSGLCLADLPLAFFFFFSVLIFQAYLKDPQAKTAFLAGLLVGVTASTKYSALALVPLFAVLEAENIWGRREEKILPLSILKDWLWGALGFFVILGLIFLPGTLWLPMHFDPWFLFWNGLHNLMAYSDYHHPTFFWGISSRENHWLYFPAAFFLKNTLPFLILLFASVWLGLSGRLKFPFWLWFSPLFFFVCILHVQNLGVRYLLPCFPFFILMAAETADWLWEKRWPLLRGSWLIGGLLIWHASTVLLNAPNMIGYFNDLVPPQNKARYLADADLDMGQDVKRLAEVGKQRGWKSVKLAQFGGAVDLSFYGIPVEPWTEKDLTGPQPGQVYAANITLFQIGPLFWPKLIRVARSWMLRTPPTGKVGDTWIYFEIPGKAERDHSPPLDSIRVF